ncbi:hypothetical protein LAZ67_15003146, partial [Cordylochernes scorpioides]
MSKFTEAIEDCKKAIQIDPKYSKAYGRMGLAYASLDQHQIARDCYRTAVELDPTNSGYRNNLQVAEEKINSMAGGAAAAGTAAGAAALLGLLLADVQSSSKIIMANMSIARQSQTFTKVCLDHGAMINESCTPIPHSMRSDVDLHAASPVAQNKQGRVQDLASKQLSILQCNINGLCSTATKIKLEEIMEIAEKQKIQIIALQETKLNEKYNLKYKNYNILRKDRNKEGGGLAFLINNLYYEDIAINIPNTSDLEAQGIKVYLNQNKTINIFNMYHPPNNKLIDDGTMAQFLTDNTIIVGDLNAKHQLWGCSTPNPRGKILSNLFDDNAFMCLNDGNPTHHSYSYNTAQALDISFSSPDIFHKCKWQILKSIGSDHLPILIEISTKTKTSSIKEKFWNFKKANWNLYQQNTNEDFRKAPTRMKDLEQNWISFKNTIIKAAKVSIPRGNIKKWIPNYTHQAKDIQTLITKRNELQKKCTQNQTNCRTELNIVNAKIKRLHVNMKREKWKQTCENLNPRNPNTKLWHLAKQIDRAQPQTENTNMIKNTDGTPATNDKNAANLLGNSYQISSKIKFEIKDKKVEKKARKIIHDCKNVTSTHNIFHEKINMKELDYALENTDLNKTPGPDGIHGQMISNLGKNGKEKLLDIFNNSWKTGKLPQDWKTATIIPIKKLDKSADDPKTTDLSPSQLLGLLLADVQSSSKIIMANMSIARQSQTFTKVCLDHGAMINESCTPIPHSKRSDVDLHAASPVAQNKQGRVQDLASKQLSILQCNINGLCSTATKIKLEEIMEIAEKQKIQIIALQETKLNEKYNLKYKNYNILRKDRNKEGGGLAFLINNLYYEDIAINIPNTSDLEAQGIKVYLNQNKTINIFNMYHPPNNKLIDDGTMAQFLTDNTIIVGDLNAKHQLWGCSTPNPRGKILSNLFDDNAFMCLNDGNPTHHSYSYNTAQALDISFSSPDIFHKCKWQILKSIGSDHLPILIEISTKTKTSSIKEKFWNFKKANWNLYQQNTNEDFRKAPTRMKDLEQNWISFKNTIIKAAKVSIPRGNIKKWIPNYTHQAKDIQTLITKRNELQKKCTQNQTNCRTELNIVNAKIKRLHVNMKREKWKQTCENLNPRNPNTKLWHLAKQIDRAQPQTENTNMIKNTDGTPATNDKNAANLLGNSYQISSKIKFEIKDKKVEKKARKIIHDCKNVTSTHNIFHEKINMKELDYALENTDLNKTPGPDGIHGQMISNLGKNGKEKLLDIFNNSWKTGKLPQDWKTATIIPIKKLDKSADDPKNYRPISLTSICCKLMEKIILRRLTYHLDTRNLLPKEQYGFRKGHGTIDQLLFFTQKGGMQPPLDLTGLLRNPTLMNM